MVGSVGDGYRLLTFEGSNGPIVGVLVEGRVFSAESLVSDSTVDTSSVLSLLQNWPQADRALASAARAASAEDGIPLEQIHLLAPILYPRAIFCAGANYWDHLEEMEGTVDRAHRAKDPWFFLKTAAHSIVPDRVPVRGPTASHQLDWEAELGVVIGRSARDVAAADAAGVIAGYTIVNDLSARDLMTRSDRPPAMMYDWIGQKCFDGAAPMGPWITPATYVEDCHNLTVKLWVNDVLKQNSNTNQLIHNVYEQVEWLSHQLTLLPGDVIATGTPAGVGMPRGDFLKTGDVMRIEIEGCGTLTNPVG